MSELTTPETEVTASPETSLDDRIAAKFGFAEPTESPPPEEPAESEPIPEDDELAPSEIPAEEISDELELTHNGQKVRVPKDEAVKLAQQGYDYTKKSQTLAEERRQLEQAKAAIKARQELTPKLITAAAKVESVKAQLAPYANVDWVALATSDPASYPTHHANYTRLQSQLQEAGREANEVWNNVQAVDRTVSDIDLQKSHERLLEKLPQWRDTDKRKAEQERLLGYMRSEGYSDDELGRINDPNLIVMARKAMLYDAAIQNRSAKQNQIKSAPAVKPGAAPPKVSVESKKADVIKQLHQTKDPTRKKALLDEALALKFGLK